MTIIGRWKVVMDEHTCKECAILHNNKVMHEWDIPPHPHCGNPDGCRCVVEETEE